MAAYTIRRLLQGVLVTLVVLLFVFSLSYLQPDGAYAPAYYLCRTRLTQACLHHNVVALGLAHPFWDRFWSYLEGIVVHLNFGYSYVANNTVAGILDLYVPRTFWLALVALVLATLIAVPLGIYQAWRRNSGFDYLATGVLFVLYAIPAFVLGFVLQDVFGFGHPFRLLPATPPNVVNAWAIFQDPVAFILPVATLTALSIAGMSRFMRSQVLDVLVQDYVRTAKAKGCSSWEILRRHTLRNALGPIAVIVGLSVPILLSGTVIVENLFNYAGLGHETYYAAINGDVVTILGITVVVTFATVIGNILADLALAVLNPRVRLEGASR